MPRQYQFDVFLLAEHVKNLQNHPAGQSKNGFDSFAS
jgi:hypothetical protein